MKLVTYPNPIERNSSAPSGTFFTHLPSHTTKHGLSARRDIVDNKVDNMMDDMVDNMVDDMVDNMVTQNDPKWPKMIQDDPK